MKIGTRSAKKYVSQNGPLTLFGESALQSQSPSQAIRSIASGARERIIQSLFAARTTFTDCKKPVVKRQHSLPDRIVTGIAAIMLFLSMGSSPALAANIDWGNVGGTAPPTPGECFVEMSATRAVRWTRTYRASGGDIQDSFSQSNPELNDAMDIVRIVGAPSDCGGTRVVLYWNTDYRESTRQNLDYTYEDYPIAHLNSWGWQDEVSSYKIFFGPGTFDLETDWEHVEGAAVDVGVGANGAVWVTDAHSNQIYRHTGSTWEGMGGNAIRIDSGPENDAYAVAADGNVWYGG